MNIAVVCANGRAGKLIVEEALRRNHKVTAIVRKTNQSAASQVIQKDLFDLTPNDLLGFDAVVDAFGAWTPETIPNIPAAMNHLANCVAKTNTRLIVVGGAGSLFINPEHTLTLDQGPDFPEDWKPLSAAHSKGLADLRTRTDICWTYLSPAANFQADGARSGSYILSSEELTLNDCGESIISYADYAIALVDEIESGNHINQRISVVRK